MQERRNEENCFTIGELSRQTGVGIETIRYYERIGLIGRPPRTQGGHRTFSLEGRRTLAFIKRSRQLGFGLDEIRALLALRDSKGACMDVRSIAVRRLEDVRAKLRDLVELEAVLADAVARCANDESSNCAVLFKLDDSCCPSATPSSGAP